MLKLAALLSLCAASSAVAQARPAQGVRADSVIVTRHEVTVSFGRNTSSNKRISESSMRGTMMLGTNFFPVPTGIFVEFDLTRDSTSGRVSARGLQCSGREYQCADSLRFELTHDHLSITLRDSARVAAIFGDKPPVIGVEASIDGVGRTARREVTYREPNIPSSIDARVRYDDSLGRDGWGMWERDILTGKNAAVDSVWLQVGERTSVTVREMQCHAIDLCHQRFDLAVASWRVSDSTVLGLSSSVAPWLPQIDVIARRPGRATVSATGLHGPADDLPRSSHTAALSAHFIVTPPLRGVRISPRPANIAAGSTFALTAQLLDKTGAVVQGAPVQMLVYYDVPDLNSSNGLKYDAAERVDLTTPGHRRFIATFSGFADTLDVRVVVPRPNVAGTKAAAVKP